MTPARPSGGGRGAVPIMPTRVARSPVRAAVGRLVRRCLRRLDTPRGRPIVGHVLEQTIRVVHGEQVTVRYAPDGSVDREIRFPAAHVSSVAFGGRDLDDLYVTSSRQEMSDDELARTPEAGGVFRASVGARGVRDAAFQGA